MSTALAETTRSAQWNGCRRRPSTRRVSSPGDSADAKWPTSTDSWSGKPGSSPRKRDVEHEEERLGGRCVRSRALVASFRRNIAYFARSMAQYGIAGEGARGASRGARAVGRSRRFRHRASQLTAKNNRPGVCVCVGNSWSPPWRLRLRESSASSRPDYTKKKARQKKASHRISVREIRAHRVGVAS